MPYQSYLKTEATAFMKYLAQAIRILIFAGIFSLQAQTAQVKCPRNFDSKKFAVFKNEISKHKGEIVSFDAEVIAIEKGYNDKPYFQVKFENGDTVWIASMVSGNYVTSGRKLRILGFIDAVSPDNEIGTRYNNGGIEVRAFAVLDIVSKNLQISDAFDKEVKEWMNGIMPKKTE